MVAIQDPWIWTVHSDIFIIALHSTALSIDYQSRRNNGKQPRFWFLAWTKFPHGKNVACSAILVLKPLPRYWGLQNVWKAALTSFWVVLLFFSLTRLQTLISGASVWRETNDTCQCTKEPLPIEDNFNVKIPSTLISCEPAEGHPEQVCLINWFLASGRCPGIFTSTVLLILYVILYHLTSSSLHHWY